MLQQQLGKLNMKKSKSKILSLKLKEVLDPEFVREVLDRNGMRDSDMPRAKLLRSNTSATLVRKRVLGAFTKKRVPRLSDLVSHTSSELKRMAKLGKITLRWLEEYLQLLGVVLPKTRLVHGMSKAARDVLASL